MVKLIAVLLALSSICSPAWAQDQSQYTIEAGQVRKPVTKPLPPQIAGQKGSMPVVTCDNCGGQQESFMLVTNNVPSAPRAVYGGTYIFVQTCATYGTLNIQVRGPNGVDYQSTMTAVAPDTTGGSEVSLGTGTVVRVMLSGTTGCNAMLSRVP